MYEILVAPPPFTIGGEGGGKGGGENSVAKQKEIKELVAVSWLLKGWGSLSAYVKKGKSVLYQKDLAVVC